MIKDINSIRDLINTCKENNIKVNIAKILLLCKEENSRLNQMEVASILKELGFKKKHTEKGNRWIY